MPSSRLAGSEPEPKEVLFNSFRTLVESLLKSPMQDREIADALDITPAQTKAWLDRMVLEGSIKKLPKRPVHYMMDRDLLDELRNA
jgi:predicted Rossmann fold nucleotide-binding protein DprA/Smf involved in DNA uptake